MNCLVIDDIHEVFLNSLKSFGISIDYRPEITPEEVHGCIENYDGLVLRSKMNVDQKLLDKSTNLKFVARAGAGVDNIDERALESMGIVLFSASEGNRDAVAEHAVGMILSLFNNMVSGSNEVKKFDWFREENRGVELQNRTVGIIGFGNIGSAFSERLSGFGCKIIAYDKYKKGFGNTYVEEVTLDELKRRTDVLSLHIPLTDETNDMVDLGFISSFSKPFWLINTARGKVVNLEGLEQMLIEKKVVGAGLDVLINEKFGSLTQDEKALYQRLFNYNNVLLTPHVAGWSVESYEKIASVLSKKIISHYNN